MLLGAPLAPHRCHCPLAVAKSKSVLAFFRSITRLLCRSLSLLIFTASAAPSLAFEPLQKSFNDTPAEASLDLNAEDVDFSSDDLRRAESLTVPPAAPGEKGRAPNGYSLLDVGF